MSPTRATSSSSSSPKDSIHERLFREHTASSLAKATAPSPSMHPSPPKQPFVITTTPIKRNLLVSGHTMVVSPSPMQESPSESPEKMTPPPPPSKFSSPRGVVIRRRHDHHHHHHHETFHPEDFTPTTDYRKFSK